MASRRDVDVITSSEFTEIAQTTGFILSELFSNPSGLDVFKTIGTGFTWWMPLHVTSLSVLLDVIRSCNTLTTRCL